MISASGRFVDIVPTARRPGLSHECPQSLRAAVDRRRQPSRASAQNGQVETLPVDLGAQPQRPRDLGGSATEVTLDTLEPALDGILAGAARGRWIVRV